MISQLPNNSKAEAICQYLLQAGNKEFQSNPNEASKAVQIFQMAYEFNIPLYKLKACEAIVKCYQRQNNIENVLIWLDNIHKITTQQSQNTKSKLINCYQQLGDKQKMFQLKERMAKNENQFFNVYFQQKQYKKCIEIIQKCLQINPYSKQLIINIFELCGLACDFRKKAFYYERMLQIEPNQQFHYIRQVYNLNDIHSYNEALALIDKALSLFGSKQHMILYYVKAGIYLNKMDLDLAIFNYKKSYQMDNQRSYQPISMLGHTYILNQQYEEAIKLSVKYKDYKDNTSVLVDLALSYYLNRQFSNYELIVKQIPNQDNHLMLLKAKIYSYQLQFQHSNSLLLQLTDCQLYPFLKRTIFELMANNYAKMKYLQMANKYYNCVSKLYPALLSINFELNQNWAEIKSLLGQTQFNGYVQNIFNKGIAFNYRHYLFLLRICQHLKKSQAFEVYQKNLDIIAHLSVQQQIVVLTHLVCIFQQTNKTDITISMYNQLYEIMTELYTPKSIKVLHEQYLKIIELSLKMKNIEKAITLFKRMETFIQDLRKDGFIQLAESLVEFFKGLREKINKKD